MLTSCSGDSGRIVGEMVGHLAALGGVEKVFARGAVHRGGPHYRLKGTVGPVSIGEDECLVLGRAIEAFRPRHCFIIGNAFGFSSVLIAKMMEGCGGESVVTLDAKCEGDGERCFGVAAELGKRMGCGILTNKVGWSPRDIDAAAERAAYDLIFIDGLHRHPQVTEDYVGVKHLAHEESILVWHDYWMLGIWQSVARAERDGFRCVKVNTSCEMVLGTRSEAVVGRIRGLYENIEEPRRRLRPVAFLRACQAMASGAARRYLGGSG